MTERALTGLSALTRLLTSPISGAQLISALVTGPLAEFGATSGILMREEGDTLVMVGSFGYTAEDIDGWETMPVAADLPICNAYRHGEVVVTSTVEVEAAYPAITPEPSRWDDFFERNPRGSIVSLPLISQGVAVGCIGFLCGEEREWGPRALALLDCLSSAVAMWITHPVSGFATAQAWTPAGTVALSDRQVQVLLLSAEGQSTAAIAAALQYSESTVKQELARVLRLLDTGDRTVAVQRATALGMLERGMS